MIDINQELKGEYHGTSQYSFLATAPRVALTDGVVAANQRYGLAYFIEHINDVAPYLKASEQFPDFQEWQLRIESGIALLKCLIDEDDEIYSRQEGCDENFPNLRLTLFLINDVLLLPSEY